MMGTSISNDKKLAIFIIVFIMYCLVNFLEANEFWGKWVFDISFKEGLKYGVAYLLVDLLGGDVILFAKGLLRYFRGGKTL